MAEMAATPNGSDKYHALMEQNMGQIGQSGVVAQNNFITVSKAQDLDYLENKRHVSLVQALGAREVGSKTVPAGPSSPAVA